MRKTKKRRRVMLPILLIAAIILIICYSFMKRADRDSAPADVRLVDDSLINNTVKEIKNGLFKYNKAIHDKNITVILDAGHGGSDSGTDVEGVLEKDINLDITLRLGKLLDTIGIHVLYTRETDDYLGLKSRIKLVNSMNADFLISIHNNSFVNDLSIKGTSTLYYLKNNDDTGRLNSKRLAQIVQEELVGKLKTNDRGTILRKNLGLIKQVNIPAVIAEIGFLTNPGDRENLMEDQFRQNTAEAIAAAVIKAIEEL